MGGHSDGSSNLPGDRTLNEFDNDAAVDEMWDRLTSAGYHGRMAPTAKAGLYAALVDDPDGNAVLISSDPDANPQAANG